MRDTGRVVVRRMFNFIRSLLSPRSPARVRSAWDPNLFVYVKMPGDIQYLIRGERLFEDPLQIVPDGGSRMDTNEPKPHDFVIVPLCGIEIFATNRDSARKCLMEKLIALAAPNGTEIHYAKDDIMLLDRLVEGKWIEGEARTIKHRSDLKSSSPNRYSYCHPDGISVRIEFRLERSCDISSSFRRILRTELQIISKHIAISNPKTVEVLLKQHIHGREGKVQQRLNSLSQWGGQPVTIVRFERLDLRPPEPKIPAIAMPVPKIWARGTQ